MRAHKRTESMRKNKHACVNPLIHTVAQESGGEKSCLDTFFHKFSLQQD